MADMYVESPAQTFNLDLKPGAADAQAHVETARSERLGDI